MKKINKIMLVAVGGLWACTGMVYIYVNELSKKIISSSISQQAMEILRQHKGALHSLGQPIKEFKAAFYDPGSNPGNKVGFKIHVLGPKSSGILFLTAEPDQDQKLHLDTIHLQIGKDDSKRLIVKQSSSEKKQ